MLPWLRRRNVPDLAARSPPVTERKYRPAVDYDELARYLHALGVPARLELLRKLQIPRASGEIDVAPSRADALGEDRAISRQAIEAHLKKLQELGLVAARSAKRDGRAVNEWFLNQSRLFVVVEELRRLSLARSPGATGTDAGSDDGPAPPSLPPGPSLLLVSGPLEGAVFPLDGNGPWIVGRERGAAVPLLYDPFVSRENARLERASGRLVLEALAAARNGTRHNWRPLAAGERVPLAAGDVLGVGRSLLVARGI